MEDMRLVFMRLSLKYVRLVFHPPYNKLKFILITRVLDGIVDERCEISDLDDMHM